MNNPYSITKDCAERFAWMFNKEHGVKISVVRALNAYGPRQRSRPVRKIIPNFILPALKGEDLIVYGDGTQVMDMIWVGDVAKILVQALLVDHGQYTYEPVSSDVLPPVFEAGSGVPTTVAEIADLVINCAGSSSKIRYVPMRPGEPPKSVVVGNPETLRPLFEGKIPELVPLEEGIALTIKAMAEE